MFFFLQWPQSSYVCLRSHFTHLVLFLSNESIGLLNGFHKQQKDVGAVSLYTRGGQLSFPRGHMINKDC